MEFSSEPSPLLLRTPLRTPSPRATSEQTPKAPPTFSASERSTSKAVPTATRSRPAYAEARFIAPDLNPQPAILRRLNVLVEFLNPRAHDTERYKVVAVDGANRNAVHLVIASLYYQIIKDLGYTVRVVSENIQPPSSQMLGANLYQHFMTVCRTGA